MFFPRHDLTHFAVETVLGPWTRILRNGREWVGHLGLRRAVATRKNPRRCRPIAELIVGFLDTERASGTRWSASEFNDKAAVYYRDHALAAIPPTLTDDDLARVRQRRAELFAQWDAVRARRYAGAYIRGERGGRDAVPSRRDTRASELDRMGARARVRPITPPGHHDDTPRHRRLRPRPFKRRRAMPPCGWRTFRGPVIIWRPKPGAWSIKEIIGHLIDSAANNHQRFVRAEKPGRPRLPGLRAGRLGARSGVSSRAVGPSS